MPGLFGRLNPFRRPLEKTRTGFFSRVSTLFARSAQIDAAFWDDLEELLVEADLGDTALEVLDDLKRRAQEDRMRSPRDVQEALQAELVRLLGPSNVPLAHQDG